MDFLKGRFSTRYLPYLQILYCTVRSREHDGLFVKIASGARNERERRGPLNIFTNRTILKKYKLLK